MTLNATKTIAETASLLMKIACL